MQTQSQPMTAGNMPGGGAAKSMKAVNMKWKPAKAQSKQPVNPIYTKAGKGEKGSVNSAKVASLKAKPNRPAPLKRKSTNKLDKAAKKALIAQRKEAAKKYAERSAEIKKERVYMKNALKRQSKHEKTLKKKQPKTSPSYPNISHMIYSVGPQPKYKAISKKFREFRKFAKTQLKHSPEKSTTEEISYLYKVGKPVPCK
jgi:hypothetical protein